MKREKGLGAGKAAEAAGAAAFAAAEDEMPAGRYAKDASGEDGGGAEMADGVGLAASGAGAVDGELIDWRARCRALEEENARLKEDAAIDGALGRAGRATRAACARCWTEMGCALKMGAFWVWRSRFRAFARRRVISFTRRSRMVALDCPRRRRRKLGRMGF